MAAKGKKRKIGKYLVDTEPCLGSGAFGVVYQGKDDEGTTIAAKEINLHKATKGSKSIDDIIQAESLPKLKELSHPNICAILDVQTISPYLWIMMEFCPYDLPRYHSKIELDMDKASLISLQCAEAVKCLHSKKITHRDIKPDNVLLKEIKGVPFAKMTDFSLARDLADISDSYMSSVKGNALWLAPELLDMQGFVNPNAFFRKQVDLFSLGLVIIYMCMSERGHKLARNEPIALLIKQGKNIIELFSQYWKIGFLEGPLQEVTQGLLEDDYNARPTAEELVNQMRERLAGNAAQLDELWSEAQSLPKKPELFTVGDYRVEVKAIGEGPLSTVYSGTHHQSKSKVALKKMTKTGKHKINIDIVKALKLHENIVQCFSHFTIDNGILWLAVEYCELGTVETYMKETQTSLETRAKWMTESSSAIAYLHGLKKPIIHGDISPANLLLKYHDQQPVIKVANVWFSNRVPSREVKVSCNTFDIPVDTQMFVAPELIMNKPYNCAVDVFSLGLIFCAMLDQSDDQNLVPNVLEWTSHGHGGGYHSITEIGKEMALRRTFHKDPLPPLVTITSDDPPLEEVVKCVILQMTEFKPEKRLPMEEVYRVLNEKELCHF